MQFYARAELIEKMKQIALLHGEFTLRSGKKSNWYFDKYRFEGIPGIMRSVAHHMARLIPEGTDRLAGIELGGIRCAPRWRWRRTSRRSSSARRRRITARRRRSKACTSPRDRILIVEDVVTTGGQAIILIQQLREAGLNITGTLAVLNRNEGANEAFAAENIPFWWLFSREDFGF